MEARNRKLDEEEQDEKKRKKRDTMTSRSKTPTLLDRQPQDEDTFQRNPSPRNYGHADLTALEFSVPDEIEKVPYSIDLYRKALLGGKTRDRSIRVNVVGNYGQGKTSLVRRLTGRNLDGVDATNGIDIERFEFKRQNDEKFKCQNEKDIASRHKLAISEQEKEDTSNYLDIWDFGGQYIFYATHTIFHSKRAIYLLVTDLSRDLDSYLIDEDFPIKSKERNNEYFLKFWMNSIHSFVGSANGTDPPVILVGTHKDRLTGKSEFDTQQLNADKNFDKIRKIFDHTQVGNHIQSADFAIDNTADHDDSIEMLRETIFKIGCKHFQTLEIPIKWKILEDLVPKEKYKKIVSLETFKKTYDLQESDEHVKLFLGYCHDKGTLIYFDEDPISHYIVLDPQYLINAFKSIITSKRFSKKDPVLRPLWIQLEKEAKLVDKMIDIIWSTEGENNFIEHKEILLAFLKKHYIISQAMKFDDETETAEGLDWYIVPSLLKDHSSPKEMSDFLLEKRQTKIRCVLEFGTISVVPTLYQRLAAATLGKWYAVEYNDKYLIYDQLLVFRLDIAHIGLIELKEDCIDLAMIYLCPPSAKSAVVADSLRRFAESVISYEFRKLRTSVDDKRKPYALHYRCNDASHDFHGSTKAEDIQYLESNRYVPCPDLKSHQINTYEAKNEWFQESKLSDDLPTCSLTEKDLSKLSLAIGTGWEMFGLELGVNDVQIERIKEDFPHSTSMRIYKMLRMWREEHSDTCTITHLVMMMKKCKAVSIDWDTIRNVIEDLK